MRFPAERAAARSWRGSRHARARGSNRPAGCPSCVIAFLSKAFGVAVPILLSISGCSPRSAQDFVRVIPGTEQVAVDEFSISVSPDERWLAFTEWVLPKPRISSELPPYDYETRIVTLDLETGEAVRHGIESIPAQALGFAPSDSGWKGQAGLEIIEERFRPPGWRGSLFYFQPYYNRIQVALDVRAPGMQIVAAPEGPGACSDCPPFITVEFRGRTWELVPYGPLNSTRDLLDDISAVFRDGAIRSIYYGDRGEGPPHGKLRILRQREVGEDEVIVERKWRKRRLMAFACVRVSPDERYLAYVFDSKKMEFFAGHREELFIRELASGQERKIATYGSMSNLIWSPDSKRLYFAGGEYETDSAVRVVDVAAAFAR